MRNIKRFTLLILILNFVIWTLFAVNENNLWYWISSSLSVNSAIILYAFNKNIRIIAKSFKHKVKKPQNNSICHCINWHPPLTPDQGKKAKCSYCGNFYNKQK